MLATATANSDWPIVVLVLAGTFLITAIAIFWGYKHQGKKIAALAASLGGTAVVRFIKGSYCRVDLDKKEGRVILIPASKYTPPTLEIKIMTQPLFRLIISEEGRIAKKLAKVGMLKDVQIGVPDFDDRYIIKAKDKVQTINYFQGSEIRAAVDELFQSGYKTIRFDKNFIVADNVKYKKESLEPHNINSAITALEKLVH